jgi:RND family efflux transporter MFP subunit
MKDFKGLILSLLLAAAVFSGCSEKIGPGTTADKSMSPVVAGLLNAKLTPRQLMYEAVGTVHALRLVTVSSKVMGAVLALPHKEGDTVAKGDLLVQLDDRQISAQLRQAKAFVEEARKAESAAVAGLAGARTEVRRSRLEFERYRKLLEGEAATRQSFETIEARYRQTQAKLTQAQAMVEAARQRVNQAQAALDAASIANLDTRILASHSGTVTAKRVEVGDLATPGMPLMTMESTEGYRVDLIIPESHIHHIRVGEKIAVFIAALTEPVADARVETVVPAADPGSRSFIVKTLLPEDPALHSGMFVRALIPIGNQAMMLIPVSAVVREGQLTGVFVVDEQKIGRFRLIRTGKTVSSMVEVISGLRAGETFVVDPPAQLVSGARVEAAS